MSKEKTFDVKVSVEVRDLLLENFVDMVIEEHIKHKCCPNETTHKFFDYLCNKLHIAVLPGENKVLIDTLNEYEKCIKPNFDLGKVMCTKLAQCEYSDDFLQDCIDRHVNCDFGNLDSEDIEANFEAIEYGYRILSKYQEGDKDPIYIITEADRSLTTILLCSEY